MVVTTERKLQVKHTWPKKKAMLLRASFEPGKSTSHLALNHKALNH